MPATGSKAEKEKSIKAHVPPQAKAERHSKFGKKSKVIDKNANTDKSKTGKKSTPGKQKLDKDGKPSKKKSLIKFDESELAFKEKKKEEKSEKDQNDKNGNKIPETSIPKPSFFSRIFGLGKKKAPEGEGDENNISKNQNRIQGELGKQIYCKRLINGFRPYAWFGIYTGNFPFSYQKAKDGTYFFSFSWKHWHSWLYIMNFFFTLYFFVVGVFSIYAYGSKFRILKHQKTKEFIDEQFYETVLIKRHFVFLWTLSAAACINGVGIIHTYMKRDYTPTIYTYYFKVIRLLHFDLHVGTGGIGVIMIMIYLLSTGGIFMMGILRFAPSTQSVPLMIGTFMFRGFIGWGYDGIWIKERPDIRFLYQILGAVFIFFIYTSSKAMIIIFIFHCKVLRNAFASWNGRTYIFIMKAAKYFVTEDGGNRLKLIYKDHCLILDIMEGLNRNFSTITETYYSLQLGSAFFEIYFFLRTVKFGSDIPGSTDKIYGNFFIRPYDWAPGLIVALQSIVFALVTSKIASDVGEEALSGIDIVRRRVFLHRKTDHDLFFQLSMQNSFDSYRRFDVAGGQYEYINKDWIQGWVNTVAGYFIILYQFQPLMDETHDLDQKRKLIGEFLTELEDIQPPDHWKLKAVPKPVTYGPIPALT